MTEGATRRLSIAVVIPAYNAEQTIARTLESVKRQTRTPDEVIVVDDGSEDATAERARSAYPGVVLVNSDHGGAAAARNTGDAKAFSDYVAYLDADDTWTPDKLEVFEKVADALGRPSFIISDFRRYVDETGEFKPLTNTDIFSWIERWPGDDSEVAGRRVRRFTRESAVGALLKGYPIWPSTALVDRGAVQRVGGWDPQFTRSQDFDLALRLASAAGMVYIDDALTVVHVHEGHGSRFEWTCRQLEWDLRVLRYHARDSGYFSPDLRRKIRTRLGRRTVYRGDFSRAHGHRGDALRWYVKALARPGGRIRGAARLLETMLGVRKPSPTGDRADDS